MSSDDPALDTVADKDLVKEATLSGAIFLVAWLIVVFTTEVGEELPVASTAGILLFVLLTTSRLVLGLGFDRLYQRMTPDRWRRAFQATIVANGATWGCLNAIVIWYYFPYWPAYLISLCTAGLAAGGTHTLNTHLRLLWGFLVLALLPGILVLLLLRETEHYTFAAVLLIYFLFLMSFSRQLNTRYWNALRNSHRLQTALWQAEAANRAKGRFLANISHEIRTPLNAVLGLAQTGKRCSQDRVVRDRFSHILKSGQHLLAIINEILDLSKLGAGKLCVESRPLDLVAIINDALGIARESAHAGDLELTIEIDRRLPGWVMGDPLRLRQILVNLLDNAVKFTQEGDVRLTVIPDGNRICFSVIDTGIGMDDSKINQIFEPFEQVDGSTTRQFGGTGLGLPISRNLARLMGGDITVQSTLDQGSTFTLCLPLETAEQPDDYQPGEVPSEAARLAGRRVLAVEDDELNRKVLCEMLEYEGAVVTLAESGRQALEYLEMFGPSAFSIVLMDVQMPMMDGYEATRRIHSIDAGLPVVGLTAHAMNEEQERCIAAGMMARLTKPIDLDVLVSVLLEKSRETDGQDGPDMPEVTTCIYTDKSRIDFLPGIDIDGARRNLKCDWTAFRKVLMTFYNSRKGSREELVSLIDNGSIEEAREVVHGIRGSCGYVGAWKLYRESAVMEDVCRTGDMDAVRKQMKTFSVCLDEVIGGLEALCQDE